MISEWMTPAPVTATPENTVEEALLAVGDARHLPVLGPDGTLLGYVHAVSLARCSGKLKLSEVRLQTALTASVDASVEDVLARLRTSRHDAIWVLADDGSLAGVFTEHDAVRVAERRLDAHRTVEDVATSPVDVIAADATVGEARATLSRRWVRHLPLVDAAGNLAGILSWRDLEGPPDETPVSEVATEVAYTARFDTPLREVARMMVARRIGAVPVLESDGSLAGIATRVDLLHAVLARPEVS